MAIPRVITELVEHFARNADVFRTSLNETEVRVQFIDPFFEALGWDIHNKNHYAETYKDVIHEYSLRTAAHTEAPDYCFQVGGTRKFYVEAKRPAVNVGIDPAPAYQLRSYAWTSKLPLSLLTNFAEFVVYDCRVLPKPNDKASVARIDRITFDQYPEKWDEIVSRFSREAVYQGSFDRYIESTKLKKGTAEVDEAFLAEIESWRKELASNIALRNSSLSQRDVNFCVQHTIDRIIFLRICEDRGIEKYGQLKELQNGEHVYRRLCTIYERADEKYNSGLFHFTKETGRAEEPDTLTPTLKIDDGKLKLILKRLYYPESPYQFSHFPAEILGQVYEQFLGQVIRLTSTHQAKVEPKPEVKRARGVYYTPVYIVNHIVRTTLAYLLEGKSVNQVSKLRVLDPACGSGSFLLGAYQFLMNWHRDKYLEEGAEKHRKEVYQTQGGDWHLTGPEKKRILLNNIFGVDIDSQAVEVTKLSLLLKVLEGENDQSIGTNLRLFHERALPDLGNNIKCGNSLISTDFYKEKQLNLLDEDDRYLINAFDWSGRDGFPAIMKTGFDAVIGNPPYDVLEKARGQASWPHYALAEYVKVKKELADALGGKLNLFRFFVVRSLSLTRKSGRFGMILPLALLADISCARTRRYLMSNARDLRAQCFPQKDNPKKRVFKKAKLSTVVLTCEKYPLATKQIPEIAVSVYPGNSFEDTPQSCIVRLSQVSVLDPVNIPIPLTDESDLKLCLKIHTLQSVRRLGDVSDFEATRGEINQTVFRKYITSDTRKARLVKGVEIGPYCVHPKLSQGRREWFDERAFFIKHSPRAETSETRIATQRITGVDESRRIVATIISPPSYFADSTNSIRRIGDSSYRLEYILALLNSKLYQWRFKLTSSNNNVGTNELDSMPLRLIDFASETEKRQHDRIVEHVRDAMAMRIQLYGGRGGHERTVLQRQIEATDNQIDRLVFQLFRLTDDEVALIESREAS